MKNKITLSIPKELQHESFFMKDATVSMDPSDYSRWNTEGIHRFKYEILAANGMASYLPWDHTGEVLPAVLDEWGGMNGLLEGLYAERNVKEAAPIMEKAIHVCFAYLFWLNLRPVVLHDWQKETETLEFIPVNFSERMSFALSRPGLYQSYKVIQQMMMELQKLAAKAQIRRK